MKKWIAFLSALALCGTTAVFAAPPKELNGKKLVEITTIAETNFDGDVQFDTYGNLGGFTFDGFNAPSIDSTPEEPKMDVTRILKNPSDPDCDDYYLKISRTKQDEKAHRVNLPTSKNYGGSIWVFNLKYMQPTASEQYFSLKYDTNDWFSGDRFIIADGKLRFGNTQICAGIVPGNWYEYTFIFDAEANTASCIVTGAFDGDTEETTVTRLDMPVTDGKGNIVDFSYVQQMEVDCGSLGKVFYVDDLSLKIMAYQPLTQAYGTDAEGNKTEDGLVDYAAPHIKAVVSERIRPDTVGTKPVTLLQNGSEIEAAVTFDRESNSFALTPQAALLPNTDYSLMFAPELKTAQGAAVAGEVPPALKTNKKPYSINKATVASEVIAGTSFQIDVEMNNRGAEPVSEENTLLVAVYSGDGALCSVSACATAGTADKKHYLLTPKAPADMTDMSIKVFLVQSLTNWQFIDALTVQ